MDVSEEGQSGASSAFAGLRYDLSQILTTDGMSAADVQDLKAWFLIHDVSRQRRIAFDRLMRPMGVTRTQWWLIAHLSRDDGMAQTDLAELLDITKATLGIKVDRLEAGGWVERRPDMLDRRLKRVYLTPKAHGLIAEMQHAQARQNRDVLKGFGREERAYLADMLTRIRRNLRSTSTIKTDEAP